MSEKRTIGDEIKRIQREAAVAEHTQGPWGWHTFSGWNHCFGLVSDSGEDVMIATGDDHSSWIEISDADRRLIAAAPDYAAGMEQMLVNEDCGGDGWWKGWEMLKAAHAKAKGATNA